MSTAQAVKSKFADGYSFAREKLPWPLLKKILTVVFFVLVAALIIKQGATIEWGKVWQTLKETSPVSLAIGAGLGFLCYCVYASYDLLGRYLLKLKVAWPKMWFAAWLSYAFNLNLSSLVGGVAFRYRLYSRLGIKASDVTRILGISVATNWLGYVLLAGGLFVSGQIDPPDSWAVGKTALQVIGAVFLVIVAAYVATCWRASKREYTFKSTTVTLPPARISLLQLVMACAHWTLMASVIYQFMADDVAFPTVFAVLLVSALAGVITHIPGGLGVLEAVFIALLAGQVEKTDILAGLFAYRCVFYLLPLAVATPLYLMFEASTRNAAEK